MNGDDVRNRIDAHFTGPGGQRIPVPEVQPVDGPIYFFVERISFAHWQWGITVSPEPVSFGRVGASHKEHFDVPAAHAGWYATSRRGARRAALARCRRRGIEPVEVQLRHYVPGGAT